MLYFFLIIIFTITFFFFNLVDCDCSKIEERLSLSWLEFIINLLDYDYTVDSPENGHVQYANSVELALSNWTFINYNPFVVHSTIFLLWSPLLFSFFIILFYLVAYCLPARRGHFFYIESNDLIYLDRYKSLLFKMYYHINSLTPNFSKKFINPIKFMSKTTKFVVWYWVPPTLKYFFIFILYFLFISVYNINNFYLSFFIIVTSCFLVIRFRLRSETVGLKLKIFLTHYFKKTEQTFEYLDRLRSLHLKIANFPILLALAIYVFSTFLLFYYYIQFYFCTIECWNGYFANSIFSYIITPEKNFWTGISFDYFIGLDGLNLWLIWLTSLIVYLCSIFCWNGAKNDQFLIQMFWIFLLQFASFQFFCVISYFWMYIFFELSLLPIFVLIIYFGSNWRKIHAAYQMIFFTFVGSIFLLSGIFMLYLKLNTFNTFDIFFELSWNEKNFFFSNFEKKIIWFCLFIGFAVKTPLYPFHIWLPEAHSEAPTTGSVLLAGVLLKMGTYGILRFVLPLFPEIISIFRTPIIAMCVAGMIFSSCAALAQIDVKKIIAYSSIGHMALVILGMIDLNSSGLLGSCYMMISHGLVSSALFFSIGILYKIYGTRLLIFYSSLAHFMPRFSAAFFFFSLSNMGFPGTAGFPPELLIFSSLVSEHLFLTFFVGIGAVLTGVYSIWLLTRLIYGQISAKFIAYRDLKIIEKRILASLALFIFLMGIFPAFVIDFFKPLCYYLINIEVI